MNIYSDLEKYTKYSKGMINEKFELNYEDITLENIDFS